MSWTDDKIARLRELWKSGLSTAAIGRELDVSKNAVVGKAHRLGLEPRPSPIAAGSPRKTSGAASGRKTREPARIADVIDLGPQMCRWPFGDPDDKDFHFCAVAAAPGRPYCEEHCAVAYVTKSGSRDRSS